MLKNSSVSGIIKGIPGIFKIAGTYKKFAKQNETGFAVADPVLHTDLKSFLSRLGLKHFGLLSEPASAGCGYGHIDSTPALYYLKMIQIELGYVIKDLINSSFGPKFKILKTFDKGYQKFLEDIAGDFEVKLNSRVNKIMRINSGDSIKVQITSNGTADTYDTVIISSTPEDTLKFLDANKDEMEIFPRVKCYYLQVTMFAGNLPLKSDALYFAPSILAEHKGFLSP